MRLICWVVIPALGWFSAVVAVWSTWRLCTKASQLSHQLQERILNPGLFSSCYPAFVTSLCHSGEPFDISWALFTVNTESLALTKALPGSVCFCACWNSLKNASASSYGELYCAHLCVHMVEHVLSFTAQWDMIVPNSNLCGIPINVSFSPPLKALNVN